VITRDGAMAKAGVESLLAPASSGITVGAVGRVRGRRTEVVGRIRMEHAQGAWEEWYCEDERGRPVWLIEEEGRFRLDKAVDNGLPKGIADAAIGDAFRVLGQDFQVTETGEAKVAGGEGQLPRDFKPGEKIRFLELSAIKGKEILSIEVSGEVVDGFVGHALSRASVDFPKHWRPAARREEAKSTPCAGCGAAMDIRPLPEPVKTLSCTYCGSVHSLHGDAASLLGENAPREDFHLLVGARGKLNGTDYEVIGRLVYESIELDDGVWSTRPSTSFEYVLVDDEGGFVTLEVGDEGVVLVHKIDQVPLKSTMENLGWGSVYRADSGRSYRQYERGQSTLIYVDGALPWVAKLGDGCEFVDMIDMPSIYSGRIPERLSVEWTTGEAEEVEAFVAQDISPALLETAFEGGKEPIIDRRILEPSSRSPWLTRLGLSWIVVALFLLMLTAVGSFGQGTEVGRVTVKSTAAGASRDSSAFGLEDGALVAVKIDTSTNNSWLYAEVDLVNADDGKSLGFIGREVSYYHGVEGGESWSEGSQDWQEVYFVPKGGRYKLRIELGEAEYTGLSATAIISTVRFDPRWAWRACIFLLLVGVMLNLWSVTGRTNLWPSDD
jgi:hypothetical protein